jgi:hypothetical protein
MPALEDLIQAADEIHPRELQTVRAMTKDEQASATIDWEDVAAKTELEEGEKLLDVAVRGDSRSGQYVTFRVEDVEGRTSSGFFELSEIKKKKASAKVAKAAPAGGPSDGSTQGGTASVPTDPEGTGDPEDQKVPPPTGVPADIAEMNATQQKALITDPPDGVDARAVAQWVIAQDEPRPTVKKAAEELLASDGSTQGGTGGS